MKGHLFYWVPVFFGLGIAIYFQLPFEPSLAWVSATIFATAMTWTVLITLDNTTSLGMFLKSATLFALITVAGFANGQIRSQSLETRFLQIPLERTRLSGQTVSVEKLQKGARITLDHVNVQGMHPSKAPNRVRIKIQNLPPRLKTGDWVSMTARLNPPSPPVMPGAFDFQFNAFFKNIGAYGFAFGSIRIEPASRQTLVTSLFTGQLENIRQSISSSIDRTLKGPTAAIAKALITGNRGFIDKTVAENMRNSGLAHLLAISGLHMGLIAGFLYFISRAFLSLIPRVALYYPIKKWAAAIALPGALIYALISGGAVPTIRSFIMTALVLVAVLLDRRGISLRSVAWAALIILIFRPESLLGPSFQMSFAAVTVLISGYGYLKSRSRPRPEQAQSLMISSMIYLGRYFGAVILTSFLAGVATAPFAIYHFNQLPSYSLMANMIAVPLTAIWVMPWGLVAVTMIPFGLEGFALSMMGWGIDGILQVSDTVSSWPGAVTRFQVLPPLGLAAIVTGSLIWILWHSKWRYLGTTGIIAGIIIASVYEPPDIIVHQNAKLTAVRTDDGQIMLSRGRGTAFIPRQWLKRAALTTDKEKWPQPGGISQDNQFRCDAYGCLLKRRQRRVSIIDNPSAFYDDCKMADVVIILKKTVSRCPDARTTTINGDDLKQKGSHALWLRPNGIIIKTVNESRGQRPWVNPPEKDIAKTTGY